MFIVDAIIEKKKSKEFLKEEMNRYEIEMKNAVPGTKEHDGLKDAYLELYEVVYPKRHVSDKLIDILKIIAPLATSVGLGIFAYHKNSNLETKDGDVWREARRFK